MARSYSPSMRRSSAAATRSLVTPTRAHAFHVALPSSARMASRRSSGVPPPVSRRRRALAMARRNALRAREVYSSRPDGGASGCRREEAERSSDACSSVAEVPSEASSSLCAASAFSPLRIASNRCVGSTKPLPRRVAVSCARSMTAAVRSFVSNTSAAVVRRVHE